MRVNFLKRLQETLEEKWQFQSLAEFSGMKRSVESPSQVILLLHGLGERGKRIFRKLISYLPDDALILAPNGPFPIQRDKQNRLDFGFSWYFYDKFEKTYFINQDLAKSWLKDLLKIENPQGLPLTIIGFSQGGYLSPIVGKEILETQLVIGLCCEFRSSLITKKPEFKLVAIHGEDDEIVSIEAAIHEVEQLKKLDMSIDFYPFKDTAHVITSEMGKTIQIVLEQHGKRSL
jgi:predicted esterase